MHVPPQPPLHRLQLRTKSLGGMRTSSGWNVESIEVESNKKGDELAPSYWLAAFVRSRGLGNTCEMVPCFPNWAAEGACKATAMCACCSFRGLLVFSHLPSLKLPDSAPAAEPCNQLISSVLSHHFFNIYSLTLE